MRAVLCREYGGPEHLRLEEVPNPTPGPGEVVIRLAAAGVNFADLLMIRGTYYLHPPVPFRTGLEGAGTISAVGEGVTDWKVGDKVFAARPGCFADYVAVKATDALPIPAGFSMVQAAGLIIGYGTALYALKYRGQVKPGETVFISGAGGGVGTAAIEIAKRLGAVVIAGAGSPEKLETCKAHGADHVLNYRTEDIRERVKDMTGGGGYDVFLDCVGDDVFDAALRASARSARLMIVGFAGGRAPSIPANYLLAKNLSVIPVAFGGDFAESPALARAVIDDLGAMHAREPFQPEIGGEYGLEDVPDALSRLAGRAVQGKLVIVTGYQPD
jgi:NADPH2:quinone reductase